MDYGQGLQNEAFRRECDVQSVDYPMLQMILSILATSERPLTAQSIADRAATDSSIIPFYLSVLSGAGFIECAGGAGYRITQSKVNGPARGTDNRKWEQQP